MSPTLQTVILVLTSSAATGAIVQLIKFFVSRHDRKKGKTDTVKADIEELRSTITTLVDELGEIREDNIVMMHDRIYQALYHLSQLDYISVTDRANVDYLAERYFARGGNHKVGLMYEQIKKIPVRPDKEGET